MKMPFEQHSLVKDIVNIFPQSSDLFKRNRLDFCCGGNRPLSEAALEQNLDVPELMNQLEELYKKHNGTAENMEVWTDTDSEELIEHIKNKYHRELEEELKMLSPYVTKVAKVHGERHDELLKVNELFYELKKELLEHTAKEEATVFPLLLELESADVEKRAGIIAEIEELEKEHDHAGSILKQLREITEDFNPPIDACGTYRLVYKRLEALESHTFMHVHLENNILFPRFIA
ncbi:iron-sulfur cluster repair di-iron protein [Mesobacillus sp. AQ2]|jgi:regulator of cell morphogenesis and NO signaling|uniref:iron-sulfur cluster repair di-iron protein n=1 Tax=Bacillaceae TaxID=186817 RepID=UPI0011A680D4|nr:MULTISPECIES: iron-sulfur cluster repair di-iron protein [Bacillaceae]MCM3124885.1 iron-sulfur cluster repair di-iron protein [Mesobacillus sp. MER 33]MCM3232806.1 iron-sulfur cluster repair di-iron protein [Mesobacillus sp. MER 48]WHX41895.1 iron-sulfur cluster repair di-iron protein [Mesobacillus sp. AQ2]